MTRIDRDMQVGEALWILGIREVKDFNALMRDTFKKAEHVTSYPILDGHVFYVKMTGREPPFAIEVTLGHCPNQEKAEKWDKVVAHLEISGTFLECDDSIVMAVLRKTTENREKLEAVKTWFDKATAGLDMEKVNSWIIQFDEIMDLKKILEGEEDG